VFLPFHSTPHHTMIPTFLIGLMLTSALASPYPDRIFNSRNIVRNNDRRARQLLPAGFRNGQALNNGAVVRRKVLRRGRGNIALAPAPLPLAAARVPIGPVTLHQHQHAGPLVAAPAPFVRVQAAPAQFTAVRAPLGQRAPLLFRNPAPAPVVAVHHHGHPALAPAFVPPPQLVAQVAAPLPVPAPVAQVAVPVQQEEPVILAVARDTNEAPTLEYGAPSTIAPEVRVEQIYGAPAEETREVEQGYGAPVEVVEVRQEYLPAVEEVFTEASVVAAREGYGAPAEEVLEVRTGYGSPAEEVVEVREGYGAPAEEVVEVRTNYLAAVPTVRAQPKYSASRSSANVKSNNVRSKPISIIRSHFNPPAATSVFDYSFESENGIKQEATGTMRLVDDTEVSVMKGSYGYVGADGKTYTVEWYADETGFHASAPHLPKSVEPNHPEVAAAVRAQLAFAADEDARAATRGADSLASYADDSLASYN